MWGLLVTADAVSFFSISSCSRRRLRLKDVQMESAPAVAVFPPPASLRCDCELQPPSIYLSISFHRAVTHQRLKENVINARRHRVSSRLLPAKPRPLASTSATFLSPPSRPIRAELYQVPGPLQLLLRLTNSARRRTAPAQTRRRTYAAVVS